MTVHDSRNRRTAERVSLGLRVVEVDEGVRYFQYATNVSSGGMYLEGLAPREPGAKVTLIFIPPGQTAPASVAAEVVGNTPGDHRGTHVRFLDNEDSELRENLRAYVQGRACTPDLRPPGVPRSSGSC